MSPEKRYDQVMHRFKREADMPVLFTDLSEEQKVLVEMIYNDEKNKEKIEIINEAVVLVQNDLDFVLHELNKLQ